jgi:hypothetical protein
LASEVKSEEEMSQLPPQGRQDDEDEWQRTIGSVEVEDSRSLWIDGRFYLDLATGRLHMAIRAGSIVLAAADPADQPVLDDILKKITDYNQR